MKRVLGFIFCLLISLGTFAQKLSVESFSLVATDISAQTQPRKDLNDAPCALVKVQFVGDILDVEGNVIKPLVKKGNETWAYMTHGSQQMKVLTKDYLPILVDFSNYGISQVEKNKTYVLVLAKPTGGAESVIQQKQSFIIRYTPSAATVLVDNKMVRGNNGVAKTTLPVGQHSFVVFCDGYESEEGTVKLKASAPSNLQITLMKESVGAGIVNQQQSENQQSSNTYVVSSSNNSSGSPSVASGGNAISIPVKNGISIEMVKVEAGTFMMGATSEMENPTDNEKPVHQVTLTNDYYMGKYEVTQALWQTVMGSNPSEFKGGTLPVETVNWNDCQEFISKLNSMTGRKFRLPTEAEWEYAARGGKESRGYQYSGSSNISDVAWYDGNSGSKTHAVGTKQPNEIGIYDMAGNVSEWCQDWKGSYNSASQTNPIENHNGLYRVHRGGGWGYLVRYCRSSYRNNSSPDERYDHVGLRLALSE